MSKFTDPIAIRLGLKKDPEMVKAYDVYVKSFHEAHDIKVKKASRLNELLKHFLGEGTQHDIEAVLTAYDENPDVRSPIDIIAMTCATAEPKVMVRGRENKRHELNAFLIRPNELQTWKSFSELIYKYITLTDECYIYIHKSSFGTELYPLPPNAVTMNDQGGYDVTFMEKIVEGRLAMLGQRNKNVNLIKIFKGSLKKPYTKAVGWGSTLGDEIDISNFAAAHEGSHLKNNARKDYFFRIPEATPTQMDEFEMEWKKKSGPRQAGGLMLTSSPDLEPIDLGSPWDSEGLLSLRKHSADVIRRSLGIPESILGDNLTSSRNAAHQAEDHFKRNVCQPRIDWLAAELSMRVVPVLFPGEPDLEIECESIIPADIELSIELLKVAPQTFTVNEVRALRGADPVSGGDELMKATSNPVTEPQNLQEEDPEPVQEEEKVYRSKFHRPDPDEPKMYSPRLNGSASSVLEGLHFSKLIKEL